MSKWLPLSFCLLPYKSACTYIQPLAAKEVEGRGGGLTLHSHRTRRTHTELIETSCRIHSELIQKPFRTHLELSRNSFRIHRTLSELNWIHTKPTRNRLRTQYTAQGVLPSHPGTGQAQRIFGGLGPKLDRGASASDMASVEGPNRLRQNLAPEPDAKLLSRT